MPLSGGGSDAASASAGRLRGNGIGPSAMAKTLGRCGGSGIGPVSGAAAGRASAESPGEAADCCCCPPIAWDGSGHGEFAATGGLGAYAVGWPLIGEGDVAGVGAAEPGPIEAVVFGA